MNSKILKMTDPPITGYPDYAYPLSIILNYDFAWEWLFCNFIQLHFDENDRANPIRFHYIDLNDNIWNTKNPLLDYEIIHRDTLALFGIDISKFIIDSINRDNYVMMYIDEYYIMDRWAYQKMHYTHMIFIYGYDYENNYFYTVGYDKNMQYSYTKISFYEIEQAYLNNEKNFYDDINKIYLIKFNMTRKRYEFDLLALIEQLNEYLYSKNSSQKYNVSLNENQTLYFGMDIYLPFKKYLEAVHIYGWDWNTVKPFHILWEHKKLMASRIKYLEHNDFLSNDNKYYTCYEELANNYFNLKVMFLKYKRTKKKSTLDEIQLLLDNLVKKEKDILEEMISDLQNSYHKIFLNNKSEGIYSKGHFLTSAYTLEKLFSGKLKIEFDIFTTAYKINCLIGYADDQALVVSQYCLPVQIRLNPSGYFDAINSDHYSALTCLPYYKNQNYKVKITIDTENRNYDVYIISSEGKEIQIADKYLFQKDAPFSGNINRFCLVSNSINYIKINNHEIISLDA